MPDTVNVPVTGPATDFDFEQPEVGHVDRTAMIRRVVELGLRYLYEYNRAEANIELDISAGQSDLAILRHNRVKVAGEDQ